MLEYLDSSRDFMLWSDAPHTDLHIRNNWILVYSKHYFWLARRGYHCNLDRSSGGGSKLEQPYQTTDTILGGSNSEHCRVCGDFVSPHGGSHCVWTNITRVEHLVGNLALFCNATYGDRS